MKFGLESEKFLFNIRKQRPSEGVYRFIDALYERTSLDSDGTQQVTNEFVLNLLEIVTRPSKSPRKILNDYLVNYFLASSVASRESVRLTPLASMPMDYLPHLTPKWAYLVQNSILAGEMQEGWMMKPDSPLRPAGNCAGIHVHVEVETAPEFLFSNRELVDKFNMGLMLTPLIAFSSSPYFFGIHEAHSMRAHRYYGKVYKNFPLNGGLPQVMESSQDVLLFFQNGINQWVDKACALGFARQDLEKITRLKGAHWNPVRWNRMWNTIEIRCLDSDRIDLDCAKFSWIYGTMKRMDIKSESLSCLVMDKKDLSSLVKEAFTVKEGKVSVLPSWAIAELFNRAITKGLTDDLVVTYLERLSDFASEGIESDWTWLWSLLRKQLDGRTSTSRTLLEKFGAEPSKEVQSEIVMHSIEEERKILPEFLRRFPEVEQQLLKSDT